LGLDGSVVGIDLLAQLEGQVFTFKHGHLLV
jgi:hypothetical protein